MVSEILSQREIDELLEALDSGDITINGMQEQTQEKKMKLYDWIKPNKFSKDQLKTLQIIYENFSRSFASFLSGILRVYCQVEISGVEPQTYREFANSVPDPALLCILDFKPLKGYVVFEISPHLAFAIIDRMLGGPGRATDKIRNFSEIEIAIIERLIKESLVLMDDAWANILETNFRLDRIESNAQLAQIVSPNETITIITLNTNIGEVEGMMNICIPHMSVEPVINQISTRYWFSSKLIDDGGEVKSDVISMQIESTFLELKAILGKASITIKEFLELQLGDVIRLDRMANEDIDITVENVNKFNGFIGLKNKMLAVQITSLERDVDIINEYE